MSENGVIYQDVYTIMEKRGDNMTKRDAAFYEASPPSLGGHAELSFRKSGTGCGTG